ncbi:Probable lysophospholipase BODYGUARD 4 [Linum perenne]
MTCGFPNKRLKLKQVESQKSNDGGRWSDCGCESCVSWTKDGGTQKLHVVVREPPSSATGNGDAVENVIFVHGFLASSSYWTESVFPNLSEPGKSKYRVIAADLLGFGQSPKPMDCFYTLQDHLEKIEDSVVKPFQLKSFHIVAHSMGCIIALALAAKYSECVKSITLVAPPYLASSEDEESSLRALEKIAKKRLWPPLMFGAALMSWYEHLGRCVCFLVCRHHRAWEKLVMLLTRSRDVHFMMRDLTRHTHHSAWHTMHNVICGGARCMDELVETVLRSKMKVCVIHGDKDPVVPLECSVKLKRKFWDNDKELRLQVVWNGDHTTVITGREKEFTRRLERIWEDSSSSFDSI